MANAIFSTDTVLTGITFVSTFATKYDKNDTNPAEQTTTFDFSEMSLGDVLALATGALIVRKQAVHRKQPTAAAMREQVAAENGTTINAKDAGKNPNGRSLSPDQIAAKLKAMPVGERIDYIRKFMPALAEAMGLDA